MAELLESKVEKRKDVLLPGRRKLLSALVVTSETVNTALDHNQAELGVTVLSVALEMLADGDGLLDEEVHILGQRGSQSYKSPTNHPLPTVLLQESENLGAGDSLHLTNSLLVSQENTNLRGSKTLLSQTADSGLDLLSSGLKPRRSGSLVGQARSRNTLSMKMKRILSTTLPLSVHATHGLV